MKPFEVIVIGGGVVGNSVLYHLSAYCSNLALLEREPDVCEGTSKANSAIVHTGFDAKPNTLESTLLKQARDMWPQIVENLKVPYLPCGAIMVATSDEEWETVQTEVLRKAHENDVMDVQLLEREAVIAAIPDVTNEVRGGLFIPGESLVDPFWLTRSYAEAAVMNGARVVLNAEAHSISYDEGTQQFEVTTVDGRTFTTRLIVNAAGLWSDDIARMVGDDSFKITPRKGQFLLTETELNLSHIVLPVPNKVSKGILVAPIVFGGYLLGPTAEDVGDKFDRATTSDGLQTVRLGTQKLLPKCRDVHSIRQFAGNRAVCSEGDFVIRFSSMNHAFLHVAGIRSTGVSASPAIGHFAAELIAAKCGWSVRPDFQPTLPHREMDDAHGQDVVCLCRTITRGEIHSALCGSLSPTTIDGLKRRTGACLGECQGNLCMPKIARMIADYHGIHYTQVEKHISGSRLVTQSEVKA